jgi:hypothetical protein
VIMKKLFICFMLLSAIIIPLACGNQNNAPSGPIGGGPTSTPTRTSTPGGVATSTSTPTPGGPTNTPTNTETVTPTFAVAAPAFVGNFGTSSSPNGMYYDAGSKNLFVAENDGTNPEVEVFTNTAGNLALNDFTNFLVVNTGSGPSTAFLVGPQGFADTTILQNQNGCPLNPSGNFYGILDVNPSGGATFYTGLYGNFNGAGATVNSWGYQAEVKPECLTADTEGNFYIADTGNGYVEQWDPCSGPSQFGLHRWNNYYNAGLGASVTFVKPYSLACDAAGNIFVGDAGVPNSQIIEFTSGGTTVVANGIFNGVAGCVVQGLAVDASDNIYISDSFNHQIEEFARVAGVWSLLRAWGLPIGSSEYNSFSPSCISLTGANIIVGDKTNEQLVVFGP